MKKFITNDGIVITGRSYKDIVVKMSNDKFVAPKSLASYRKATAKRTKEIFDKEVRYDTDAHFIKDLVAIGVLVKPPEDI